MHMADLNYYMWQFLQEQSKCISTVQKPSLHLISTICNFTHLLKAFH